MSVDARAAESRAAESSQCRFVKVAAVAGEAAEDHPVHVGRRGQRIGNGSDRDAGRTVGREVIDASGDRRESYRRKRVRLTEFKGAAIAGGEQFILARIAAVPDRTDGMDHMLRRQAVSARDPGVTGRTAVERAAFGDQFGAGPAMNSAIDAAPAEQGRIRGVDDGVNAQCRDVGNDDFQPRLADPARGLAQAEAAALMVTPLSVNSCCSSPAWNISRMMSQPPTNSPFT